QKPSLARKTGPEKLASRGSKMAREPVLVQSTSQRRQTDPAWTAAIRRFSISNPLPTGPSSACAVTHTCRLDKVTCAGGTGRGRPSQLLVDFNDCAFVIRT